MVLHEGGNYNDMISAEPAQQTVPEAVIATPVKKEGWIHAHPYLATTLGIGGLVFLGFSLVIPRSDVSPTQSSGAWGGAGGIFFGTIKNALPTGPTAEDITKLQSAQNTYAAIPIYKPVTDNAPTTESDDLAAIFAQLVQKTSVTTSSEVATPDSYSYIPQGYVSTETPVKKRTATQEALYTYGNQLGTYVKGYEDTHYNSAQILKDHVEDRANPDKIRALKILGTDMQQLGNDMKDMPDVPASVAAIHRVYANAYFAAGANILLIADTSSDESFVSAIGKYNAVIEKLSAQFQSISALFVANEVTFSASEPGSIFMFNPNLSLAQ